MADDRAPAGGDDDGDEAAKAFEALRKSIDRRNSATTAELKTIRKGMGKSRWDAGATIMHVTNPEVWKAAVANAQLGVDNVEALTRCRQVAFKTRQTQKCTVKVGPDMAD